LALVAFDPENEPENRITYCEKRLSIRSILKNDFLPTAIFAETYYFDNGKEISRIYVPLKEKVSIHNKNTWQVVMELFNENMALFEDFFIEYEDILKD
jgi:hypothetical protein